MLFLLFPIVTGCHHKIAQPDMGDHYANMSSLESNRAQLGDLYVSAAHHPSDALAAHFARLDPETLFKEAVERRQTGDVEGAVHRLVWLRNTGDTSPAVLYQIGIAYERIEDFEMALRVYNLMLTESDDIGVQRDTGFRRAQVLEELGRDRDALAQLDWIEVPEGGFSKKDQLTFDIERFAVETKLGMPGSEEKLLEALEDASLSKDLSYIRAKGWSNLIVTQLEESTQLPIDGNEVQIGENTETRAATIIDSEELIADVLIPLSHPRWTLMSFLALGDAYTSLSRDIETAPTPPTLTLGEESLYASLVDEQSGHLVRRAWTRYDSALTYAGTLGLDTRETSNLEERLAQTTLEATP